MLDDVFARGDDGRLRFHAAHALDAADVTDVLAAIAPEAQRLVARDGGGPDDPHGSADAFAEASPLLAGLAASVQGSVALGGTPGARPRQVGQSIVDRGEPALGGSTCTPTVRVPAGQRDRLERVCCYALRPPVAEARLHLAADGQVVLQLRRPWADGTTHVTFPPTAFLERLAMLVPRPHVNFVVPRAAGPACRVARRGCAGRRPERHDHSARGRPPTSDASPLGPGRVVGLPDAPRVRGGRSGLPALWRPVAFDPAD